MGSASLSPGENICKYRRLIELNNDESNATFTSLKKNKIKVGDTAEYKFEKKCIVYTTKLDDMQIFKIDMQSITMKKLLDNILIESLPILENIRPYVFPSIEVQKRKYKELFNTLEIVKQKTLFLRDLANISVFNNHDVANENTNALKSLSEILIKSEPDANDDNADPLKFSSEIYLKSELHRDDEGKEHSDTLGPSSDTLKKSQLVINGKANHESGTLKTSCDYFDTDGAAKDNLDALGIISQAPGLSNVMNVESEYKNCERMECELQNNNTKHTSSNLRQLEKIEELFKLCKPASVVLTDFRKKIFPFSVIDVSSEDDDMPLQKLKTIHSTPKKGNYRSSSRPKKLTRDKPQYLGAFKQFIKRSNIIKKPKQIPNILQRKKVTMTTKIIVIMNIYSKDVDIYCINKRGCLVDYHKTNENNIENVLTTLPKVTYTHKKEICCWYKREEFIKMLSAKYIDVTTQKFMRKPHTCLSEKCACCCKRSYLYQAKKSNSISTVSSSSKGNDIMDVENEIFTTKIQKKTALKSNGNSFKGSSPRKMKILSTLIDKAMIFKKHTSLVNTISLKEVQNNCLRHKLIITINVPKKERECFELGSQGQVVFYLKGHTNDYYTNSLAQKLTDLRTPTIAKPACCWVQRQITVSKLIELGLSRNVANFIRASHKCSDSKCLCCCNKNTLNNTLMLKPLVGLNLPKRAGHSKRNIYLNVNKHGNTIENIPMFYKKRREIAVTNHFFNYSKDKFQLNQGNTMTNIETKNNNIAEHHKIDLTNFVNRNPEKNIDTSDVSTGVDSSCVQKCIRTILNTFQGVRLTINNEGKVAAALSTSVTSLSTPELKVLASIISCAQNEVDALGVFPGTKTVDSLFTAKKSVQALGVSSTKTVDTSFSAKETVRPLSVFPETKTAKASLTATQSVEISSIQANLVKVPNISSRELGKTSNNTRNDNYLRFMLARPSKPPPNISNAPEELTLKSAPKPNKALLEPFANLNNLKRQNFQESFLSYFGNAGANIPTPIIKNVFSLQPTDETSSTSKQRHIHETTQTNELQSNSIQIADDCPQTNKIKTCVRKRKTPEEHPEFQKKPKTLPMQPNCDNTSVSTLQDLGAETPNLNKNIFTKFSATTLSMPSGSAKTFPLRQQPNILTKVDHSDITINNISNALPINIPSTYPPSQSGNTLSVILPNANEQNFMTLNPLVAPPSQAIGFVAPAPIIPVNPNSMLLVTPLVLTQPAITVFPYNENVIKSESDMLANDAIDTLITTPVVKSEVETLDKQLEEIESFETVKEEECILGV